MAEKLTKEETAIQRALATPGVARGLPPAPVLPRPLEDQREYHRRLGAVLNLEPFDARPLDVKLNEKRSKEIAAKYHALQHDPNDPEVKASYDQFKKEIVLQYRHMLNRGLTVEPWTKEGQPYESSKHMIDSVLKNHHLFYYKTTDDQIPADHPMAEEVPGMPGVKYNDLFRAVHDYFGHAVHHNGFGPLGEIKAWMYHRRMFSPLARRAMTTDTMGQNSWVNYGPHEPWKLPLKDRPFPPQKAGVMKLARSPSMGDLAGGYARLDDFLTAGRNPDQRSVGPGGYVTRLADDNGIAVERNGRRLVIAHPDGGFTFPLDHGDNQEARIIHAISGASIGFHPTERPGWPASRRARRWTSIFGWPGAPRQALQPGKWWHPKTGYPKSERDIALSTLPHDILADWLQDRGIPGAHITRAHDASEHPAASLRRVYDASTGALIPAPHTEVPAPHAEGKYPPEVLRMTWEYPAKHFVLHVRHGYDAPDAGGTQSVWHSAPVHSLRHLNALLSDFNPAARKRIVMSLKGSAIPLTSERDGPVRLARVQAQGLGAATRAAQSDNHEKRVEIARDVLRESGLRGAVRAVLAHSRAGSKPSVLAVASHVADPQHALFTGAYIGLLAQEPRITVFTPGEGEDTMHVFDSPQPVEHVAQYMRRAHAGPFVTEARPGGGTRATLVAPLDSIDANTLARGLHASHTATRGRADRIGSSAGPDGSTKSAAAGRAAYRTIIADAERATAAGTEQPPARVLPARLARSGLTERDQALRGMRNDPAILADWLQDNNIPGAQVVRRHSNDALYDVPTTRDTVLRFFDAGTGDDAAGGFLPGGDAVGLARLGGRQRVSVFHKEDSGENPAHAHRVLFRSLDHLNELLDDVPEEARKKIIDGARKMGVPERG